MRFDHEHWAGRLDALRERRGVPGAALGVLQDRQVHEVASGVLNVDTGVEVRPGSLFLSGSIAKAYTATAVMVLVEQGRLSLGTPVTEVLPGFRPPDTGPGELTVGRLLSHTGGLTCDFTLDTGRGDDCLERYVDAAAEVRADCPPGLMASYSSVGYAVLGRVVEVLTGTTWDQAVADLVTCPLGLDHTVTLPEEALRFRAAMGHLDGPDGSPVTAPAWDLMPRSAGPYGRVVVSAGDLVRFAQSHLDDGATGAATVLTQDGRRLMRERVVDTRDPWTLTADGWGHGWSLNDWDGTPGFGHDGSAVTQDSFLRVVPDAGVAVALMTNGGDAAGLHHDVLDALLHDLAGVTVRPPFEVPVDPPAFDLEPWLGTYRRAGVEITLFCDDAGAGHVRYAFIEGMAHFSDPIEAGLVPVDETTLAATGGGFGTEAVPVMLGHLPDGTPYAMIGMRVAPRV